MKNDLNNLLSKEMDRTDFLKHVGIAVIAMTGFASIVRALGGFNSHKAVSNGFGSGSYGGNKLQD